MKPLTCEITFRQWHSVNLVPHMSAVSIVDDNTDHHVIGRMYQLVWLGLILDVMVPTRVGKRAWSTWDIGPRWSRRNKEWRS